MKRTIIDIHRCTFSIILLLIIQKSWRHSYLAPMQMVSDKRKENVYGKD